MVGGGDLARVAKGAGKVAKAFLRVEGPVVASQALRLKDHGGGLAHSLKNVSMHYCTFLHGRLDHIVGAACVTKVCARVKVNPIPSIPLTADSIAPQHRSDTAVAVSTNVLERHT